MNTLDFQCDEKLGAMKILGAIVKKLSVTKVLGALGVMKTWCDEKNSKLGAIL